MLDIDYAYSRGRRGSAAEAAGDLEDDLLSIGPKSIRKRPSAGEMSDDSSDADVPIAARHGPANKKRKLAKAPGPEGIPEIDAVYVSQNGTGVPLGVKALMASAKSKGKQREQSVDSVSATPHGRKRGSKKKLDGFPPQAQELFALGSVSTPFSRDVSPVGSRAVSPALTTNSTTIYELDEVIPSLKKARRLDDASMWKRVKSLEEAQRKVWTNIARRDIVKVYAHHDDWNLAR
jgi:chromatin-remodeling ATPase INO80